VTASYDSVGIALRWEFRRSRVAIQSHREEVASYLLFYALKCEVRMLAQPPQAVKIDRACQILVTIISAPSFPSPLIIYFLKTHSIRPSLSLFFDSRTS
jgi:hypothetical protein